MVNLPAPGRRVVVRYLLPSGQATDALGELPESIHVEQEVPQAQVLTHVDLVVHHGGTGTVIGSLTHGLPQVVMPQGADQFWNAEHLAAEGACRVVPPGAPPGSVASAAAAVVDERAPERAAARRLGGVIDAMPSPDAVARRLHGTPGSSVSTCGDRSSRSTLDVRLI